MINAPHYEKGPTVPIEHEAKILDIDADAIEKLILERGGQKLGEKHMRRFVYDIDPNDQSKWIRLRDSGNETTLTVKKIMSDAIDGTHEVEIGVDDFGGTNEFLAMVGFKPKSYQENKRVSFLLDGAQVEIDTWPKIPPLVEIEAGSKDEVVRVAALLGFAEDQLTGENTIKVYARYGIDLTTITDLRF